ncbi:MAG: hypothetical protein H6845_02445 [Alphaproteobacteria bacterium]|nr:MAG: hypothetical protein H6845_02445 [Alphaproteobacteria bacterium]
MNIKLNTRIEKDRPLTHAELDENWTIIQEHINELYALVEQADYTAITKDPVALLDQNPADIRLENFTSDVKDRFCFVYFKRDVILSMDMDVLNIADAGVTIHISESESEFDPTDFEPNSLIFFKNTYGITLVAQDNVVKKVNLLHYG